MDAKKLVMLITAALLLAPFALANSTLTADVDILVPEKVVSIQVQDSVSLGNITLGYGSSKTGNVKVYINNTGTVPVFVTPTLAQPDEIYSYLWLTKRLSGEFKNWAPVGEWTLDIDQPSSLGGVEKEYFYVKLDLEEFDGELDSSLVGHEADILFVAVEQ